MIIDFHTHVFPERIVKSTINELESKAQVKAATDGTVNGLINSMQKSGIDYSVVLPVVTAPKQFDSVNNFANMINETYSQIISFAGIHPETSNYKDELKKLKDMGFKGIKLHPDYQGTFFNDIRYKRIICFATELEMTIVVHAGVDIGLPLPIHCTPYMSAEVLKDTMSNNIILAHMGGWKMWDDVEKYLVGKNVYFDTGFVQSYIEEEQFYRIIKNHGSDRILFATDSPWTDQEKTLQWIRNSRLPYEDISKILTKNALKLLKI